MLTVPSIMLRKVPNHTMFLRLVAYSPVKEKEAVNRNYGVLLNVKPTSGFKRW